MSVFLVEILCFERWRNKKGGEMLMEELSINFIKNWRNIGDFLEKSPPVGKSRRYFGLFRWFFIDFFKKLAPSPYCWSDSSQLPRVDLTVQIWFELQQSISCASDGPNWSWMWSNGQNWTLTTMWWSNGQISPRFRSNGQFCFPTVKWDSNSYFGPTFFYK